MADDYGSSVGAGNLGTLTLGGSTNGTLEAGADHDWFQITLVAGQSYIFNMDRGTLGDPFLVLRDQNGVDIVGNDDINGAANVNSQIRFTATVSGTYYLDAFSSDGADVGTYTVRAAIDPSPPASNDDYGAQAGSPNVGTVAIGGSTNGNLETAGDRDWFAVTLTAGTSYTFRQTGSTLNDTFLRLRDGNGLQIAANDDIGGGNFNSLINYTATVTGVYYLEANTADQGGTGTYTVSAAVNGNPPPPPTDDFGSQVGAGNLGSVAVGSSSTGVVNYGGDHDWFAVTLSAGSIYRIRQEVGTLADPRFTLRNSIGGILTGDDDSGGGQNAQVDFTATTSGTYYIDANSADGAGTGNYTVRVTLLYGAPVIATNTGSTAAEGAADTITASELSTTDADTAASAIIYTLTSLATNGTLTRNGTTIALNGTFTQADINSNLIVYNHNGSETTSGTFGFSVSDGTTTFTGRTFNFTVTPVDDAPVLSTASPTLAYTENGAASVIAPAATVTDADSANFDTGTLTVSYTAGGTVDDRLTILNQGNGAGQIGVAGNVVNFGGVAIGSFTGGTGTTPLVVTFNSAATPAAAQALTRDIAFANASENPSTTARSLSFVVTDGDGGTSAAGTAAVTVTAVNDAPVNSVPLAQTINEDNQLVFSSANSNAITVSDVDVGAGTLTVTLDIADGALILGGTSGLTVTGQGGHHVVLTGTAANINTGLNGLSWQPAPDVNGSRTLSITTSDNGNSGSGGALQDVDTVTININAVDDSPVAVTDAYSTNENVVLNVPAAGVLTNDTDIDGGPKLVASVNGVIANVGAVVTLASGAKVTLNADGSLSYDPNHKFDYLVSTATAAATGALDTAATDSFTYALNGGSSTTVTVTINGVDSAGDHLNGNGGANTITGTGNDDFFDLSQGGNDNATGLGGNDVFLFGATLTPADVVDGGAGLDQVAIQGNYAGGSALTLGTGIVGIESLAILPGNDIRFGDPGTNLYSYDLTTVDQNVASGVQMVVDASRLRAGESFTFNGAAETDGSFFIYGGVGIDHLTGGGKNDVFLFGMTTSNTLRWGASDQVTGGAGLDQLALRGDYSALVTFGATQLISIEAIGLVSAHDTRFGPLGAHYSYNLQMNDGNVAAGVQMTVDGTPLHADEILTFDGSQELNGSFRVFGGKGDDTIIGSAGNDILSGGLGADLLTGNAGDDTFLYRNASESTHTSSDTIQDFTLGDIIDLTQIDADTILGGDQAFTFIGTGAFDSLHPGELRIQNTGGSTWLVQGDTNGDNVADFEMIVTLHDAHPITSTDFHL